MNNKNKKIIFILAFIIISIALTLYLNSKQLVLFSKANNSLPSFELKENVDQINNNADFENTFKQIEEIDIDQIDKSLDENLKDMDNL